MSELLTAKQLAERLQCSERTIHAWRKAGLPAIKVTVGRLVRFDLEAVQRWLLAQQPGQTERELEA